MNHLGALIVLALAVGTCAGVIYQPTKRVNFSTQHDIETSTESFLNPTDSDETARLMENQKFYSSFCIESRDHLYQFIKTSTNGVAGWMFRLVITSATESYSKYSLNTLIEGGSKLVDQVKHTFDEKVAEHMAASPKSRIQSFLANVKASGCILYDMINSSISEIVQRKDLSMTANLLYAACLEVARHEQELKRMFENYKKQLKTAVPNVKEDPSLVDIPCVTSSRVIRARIICEMSQGARSPMKKIIATMNK